jgi:hypothetical protein
MVNNDLSYIVVGVSADHHFAKRIMLGDRTNKILKKSSSQNEIWLLNPVSKQRLRVIPANHGHRILDIYACNSGIYHATEIITPKYKKVKGEVKRFDINAVQIFDTITMNSFKTIVPKGSENLPLEKRLIPLNFWFVDKGNSLLNYVLNEDYGVVFDKCIISELNIKVAYDGNMLYLDGKKITAFDKDIIYARAVDATKIARAYKKKDRVGFDKNKDFFYK